MNLQEQERLSVSQRLSAVFLVADIGRPEPVTSNIFLPVLEQVCLQGTSRAPGHHVSAPLVATLRLAVPSVDHQAGSVSRGNTMGTLASEEC